MRAIGIRVARASRALVRASRQHALLSRVALEFVRVFETDAASEVRFGGTPKPTRGTRVLPGFLLATILFGVSCFAQDSPEEVPEIPEIPTAEAQPAATPPKPQTPEEKAVAEFLALKFDRNAALILQAHAALAASAVTPPKPPELLRLNVVAGRWREVGAFLKTLPPKSAPIAFSHILKDLDRIPITAEMQQQQQQLGGPKPSPTLLQDDVLELADITPADLTADQISQLGALLRRALEKSPFADPLLKRLEKGTLQFGGTDPVKRERAAQLLLDASRDLLAIPFLAPLEAGCEAASFPLLEKHVRCAFTKGKQENDAASIARAWQLNQTMLAAKDCPADMRERGSLRNAELLPFLPTNEATQWLKETFTKDAEQGMKMLVSVGQQVANARAERDAGKRQKNLTMQRQVVDALLPLSEKRAQWQPGFDLFAMNWMEEADYSRGLHVPPQQQGNRTDMYGNPIYYGNQRTQNIDPNKLQPIPLSDVLPAAPDEAWLAVLDPSLVPRALTTFAAAHLKLEDDGKALTFIERLAPFLPEEATRLGNELLGVWATSRDPNRGQQQQMQRYYASQGIYMNQQSGIPLTRALQQRYLEGLSVMLKRLRALAIPPLEDSAIVTAFTAAHSPAEVFREESIELALGKIPEVKAETLGGVLHTMRERLASQWRKPNVQQQAKTQRTDAQIEAEVLAGYELLESLIRKGLEPRKDEWSLHLLQATTQFDRAEFQYGKKVDLSVYVEKRESAFTAFQHAAELYSANLPKLAPKDETPAVFQYWLNANLGASDLAMVTRQQEPSMNQLDRVRAAILALPGDAAARHLDLLAKAVTENAGSIPGNLKARYMTAALRVIGERPAAEEIQKLAAYHAGLLREIELNVRVDGDTTVGHGKPFGVFFGVRHTAELERENQGGFGKYLQNQTQSGYYNRYGIAPVDHRDDLEKQMREKLNEGFEILSITFHDEKVQSRGYGRAGWRETPLAYLLLKAKDASVDRLPSLRLDVDFLDSKGPVVLPVESAVPLIDARPDAPPTRPVVEMDVTQTLDDRALNEGRLTLEVKATARGLVPDFDELFEFTPAGFKVDGTEDSGPAVQRLDSEKDDLAAASERNWVVKMSAEKSPGGTARFVFPKPKRADLKVAYKRYVDADLADAAPELSLSGLPLNRALIWQWALLGTGALVGGFFIVKRLRARASAAPAKIAYALPGTVTPFTALDLLRRMHSDESLALSPHLRTELSTAITTIESYYFSAAHNGTAAPDLDSIGRQWVASANR